MRLWPTRFCCLFLVALFLIVPAAFAAPSVAGTLRCALIDVDRSPLGGLVEGELLVRPGEDWLERTEIERLVAEKQLQSLLAANAGEDRSALGQLLKADVLVILKTTAENDQSFAELVVAETNHGLRLVSQRLPLGQNLEEVAKLVTILVDKGIAKASQEIKHVFAIPPFVNNDLTYEFDYLKSTYAKLLEQSLLDSVDVVVVELEEARAVADERKLTAANDSLKRQLPIYLLGEYRNQAEGEQRKVQLRLRFQQGTTEIDSQQVELRPEAVPDFLRRNARKIAESQGIETPPSDPAEEARQLNERAQQFIRLANWQEALGLIEASLLLLPDQPEMHSEAIRVAGHLANTYDPWKLDELEKAKELNRRSLEHLRTLAARYSVQQCKPHFDLLRFPSRSYLQSYGAGSALTDRLARLEETYRQEKYQLAVDLARRLAEQHNWRASAFLLNQVVSAMTPERRYAELTKMILQYQDGPQTDDMVRSYAHEGYTVDKLRTLEARRFLEQLRDTPEANDQVKRTAEDLLRAIGTLPEAPKVRTIGDPNGESRLTFRPLDLTYRNSQGSAEQLKVMDGCLPLDTGVDAFFGSAGVFIYSKREGLRQLWKPLPSTWIRSFDYDGRYLWLAATVHQQAPQVWVFDPVSGQSSQITAEHGLPLLSPDDIPGNVLVSPTVSLATVEKGKAILAGDIGRTWLAEVQFNPRGKHKIKIFHEAKEVIPPGTTEADWRNIDLAFQPVAVRTFSSVPDSGNPKKMVMINRGSSVYAVSEHALLIDPEDLSVRVAEEPWHHSGLTQEPSNLFEGFLYYAAAVPHKFDTIGLLRIGMPDFKPRVAISGIREGYVLINQQQKTVNVVGIDWQRGRLEDEKLESFGPVPWLYSNTWGASERTSHIRYDRGSLQLKVLADSHHFGTILSCAEINGGYGIVQVLFDGSGVSLKEALNGPANTEADQRAQRAVTRPRPAQQKNLWQDRIRTSALAYSPDGSLIVTTSVTPNEAVQAWDAKSGQLLADLLNDPVGMTKVAFSHDGERFVTGGKRGRVIVWDTNKLTPIAECEGQTEAICHVAFSWKDDKVAAASRARTAMVWNTADGNLLFEVEQRNVGIDWVGFSANNSLFLTSSPVATQAWNATDGSAVGQVESLSNIAGTLKDRSLVALGKDADNTLIQWDSLEASSEELWPRMEGIPVAVSPDGKLLATYIREKFVENERKQIYRVVVWDLPNKKQLATVDGIMGVEYLFTPNQDALLMVLYHGGFKRLELRHDPAPTDPPVSAVRTWTDSTGQHKLQATLSGVRGQEVQLETAEGKTITIPLDRLSPADRAYIREHASHRR